MNNQDHIEIYDSSGRTLLTRLGENCRERCVTGASTSFEKCEGHTRRRGLKTSPQGTVFLCTSDADMLKSKRVFSRTLDLYLAMISGLAEIQKNAAEDVREESRRLVHNLTTLNSHIIQEIYNIVPQDDLAGTPKQQMHLIERAISVHPGAAAQATLKILKNAVAARTEMQIVRRLSTTPHLPPQIKPHKIHKVIKNVLITFFQEAMERDIYWNLQDTSESVLMDYELVSVALYRLFENCVKYCAPNSTVEISFQSVGSCLDVFLTMTSILILSEEETKIFDEGISGASAKRYSLNGSGIGLYIARRLLELNETKIIVSAGTQRKQIRGIDYAENRFKLTFVRFLKRNAER